MKTIHATEKYFCSIEIRLTDSENYSAELRELLTGDRRPGRGHGVFRWVGRGRYHSAPNKDKVAIFRLAKELMTKAHEQPYLYDSIQVSIQRVLEP